MTIPIHPDVKAALAQHVQQAISGLDPARFAQEANYVAALMGRLIGVVYSGPHGHLQLNTTVVNDRGRGSAESFAGADFAITATVGTTRKAVIGQAKKGATSNLSKAEGGRLADQVLKMRRRTKHYIVLETPHGGARTVAVRRSVPSNHSRQHPDQTLADYLELVIRCTHGDTRTTFVDAVEDSALPTLEVSYAAE